MQHGAAQALVGIGVGLKRGGEALDVVKQGAQTGLSGVLLFRREVGDGAHGQGCIPVHGGSLRVHERLGEQPGVGFSKVGPQQPVKLGVAGVDL